MKENSLTFQATGTCIDQGESCMDHEDCDPMCVNNAIGICASYKCFVDTGGGPLNK